MNTISQLISTPGTGRIDQHDDVRGRESRSQAERSTERGDRLDLSPEARAAQSQNRTEQIQRIRAELAGGTYLTEDKLDVAIERLTRELLEQS